MSIPATEVEARWNAAAEPFTAVVREVRDWDAATPCEGWDALDLLAKIEEMPEPDRALAVTVHRIVTEVAPELAPRTWYGMPAYARGTDVLVFLQVSSKFGVRYTTLG